MKLTQRRVSAAQTEQLAQIFQIMSLVSVHVTTVMKLPEVSSCMFSYITICHHVLVLISQSPCWCKQQYKQPCLCKRLWTSRSQIYHQSLSGSVGRFKPWRAASVGQRSSLTGLYCMSQSYNLLPWRSRARVDSRWSVRIKAEQKGQECREKDLSQAVR